MQRMWLTMEHRVVVTALVLLSLAGSGAAQDSRPSNYPWEAYNPDAYSLPGVMSEVFRQQYRVIAAGQTIAKTRFERANADAAWKTEDEEYTVSYFFTSWCGREGGDEIYLCGLMPSGQTIIERWRYTVPAGRWIVHCPTQSPLGTPAADYQPSIVVKGGGEWRWSKAKTYPPDPQRRVLYEGNEGPFTAMDVDPEGRQLLLYDFTTKAIRRINLANSVTSIETLYTAQAYPHLSQLSSLELRDFGTEGRKLLTRKQYAGSNLEEVFGVFSDPDNDGNFSSVAFLTRSAFVASPYGNWPSWQQFWSLE